jgi:uncharacterized protein YdeI (YjbR/CyaY-like superfamily)
MGTIFKAYIKEAIAVEKAGLDVNHKKTSGFVIPEGFQNKLNGVPGLKPLWCTDTGTARHDYLNSYIDLLR